MAVFLKNLSISVYKPQFFSIVSILHRAIIVTLLFMIYTIGLSLTLSTFIWLLCAVHFLYVNQRFFTITLIGFLLIFTFIPAVLSFMLYLILKISVFVSFNS